MDKKIEQELEGFRIKWATFCRQLHEKNTAANECNRDGNKQLSEKGESSGTLAANYGIIIWGKWHAESG